MWMMMILIRSLMLITIQSRVRFTHAFPSKAITTTDLYWSDADPPAPMFLSAYRRTWWGDIADQAVNATYVAEHLLASFRYAAEINSSAFTPRHPSVPSHVWDARLFTGTGTRCGVRCPLHGIDGLTGLVFRAMQRHDNTMLPGDLKVLHAPII
jgi:hypothetical protein